MPHFFAPLCPFFAPLLSGRIALLNPPIFCLLHFFHPATRSWRITGFNIGFKIFVGQTDGIPQIFFFFFIINFFFKLSSYHGAFLTGQILKLPSYQSYQVTMGHFSSSFSSSSYQVTRVTRLPWLSSVWLQLMIQFNVLCITT